VLRGIILIVYYQLMRPVDDRVLTWEEVTLNLITSRA